MVQMLLFCCVYYIITVDSRYNLYLLSTVTVCNLDTKRMAHCKTRKKSPNVRLLR